MVIFPAVTVAVGNTVASTMSLSLPVEAVTVNGTRAGAGVAANRDSPPALADC